MKEMYNKIMDYLIPMNLTKDQTIMVLNPIENEEEAKELLNWIKNNQDKNWQVIRKKSLEIRNKYNNK